MPVFLLTKPASDKTVTYNQARAALVEASNVTEARAAANALMPPAIAARGPFNNFDAQNIAPSVGPNWADRYFTGEVRLAEAGG
ncbi:MAG: hypothetical protein AAGK00_13590 [Pseudomonadota bacterium]